MKKIIKKISMILVISICITILAPCKSVYAYTQTAAATNDYTTWKQTSSTWGDATPWPNASIPKFGDAGCWITSVAILLRHYGVVTDSNVNTFNPLICNNRLMSYGIVNNQGDFCNLQNMRNAYPGFEYVGTKNYSFSNLKSLYDQGYACIVHETRGHYVAVRSVSSSSVVIMDPGYSTTSLTASDSIQYFKATKQSIPDVTGTPTITGASYPSNLGQGASFNIKGIVSATSSLNWVWVGVDPEGSYDHIMQAEANPGTSSYDISKLASKLDFSSLKPGSYTFKVHVITSNPNKYYDVVSHPFTVVDSTPKISGGSYPSNLGQGASFNIKGIVSATSSLNWVWVGVDPEGSYDHIMQAEANPGTSSYDISKLASKLDFSSLKPGSYTFKVHVITSNPNKYYDVVSHPFTVVGPTPKVTETFASHTYELYDCSMSWKEAKAFCEKQGGHLVTIKDKSENDFITSLIKQGNKNYYHIGCTDEEEEGVWKWITGEDFSYNNWDPQAPEPNGGTNENYGAIISIENPPNKQSGEWMDGYNYYNSDDYYSSKNAGFVCEYETIQKEISDCTIELESTQYTYDGKEKKPKVTIKDGTEELLIDVDYTIVYNNYIDAGIATVTITGKGNYTGKHTKIYGIAKATQDMTASVTKTSFKINDKEQIKTTGIGTITYVSSNTLVATVTATGQITAVGEGEATITVEAAGDSNYKSASKSIEIVVTKEESENIPKLSFVDVPKDAWFFDYVKDIYNEKLMTGLDATHFGALDNLARAQFAVILHRMNGDTDEAYIAKFPDVPDGIWFTDAVLWANKNGVITGYSHNGHFGPGDKITREQMAVMMYRYADYMGYDTSEKEDFSKFNDAAKVNDFAKEAMQWAVGNGIITGKNNGTALDPQGNASRAECATIIMRFMEKYEK